MSSINAIGARLCTALLSTFFCSSLLAQVTPVPNRATLGATDFIDWQSADDGAGDYTYMPMPGNIGSDGGDVILVSEPYSGNGLIISEPSQWFRDTNLPDGDYLFDTLTYTNDTNPVSFSYADGRGFCGFGTQVATYDFGEFVARVEAFDANDVSVGFSDVTGSDVDPVAVFVGISSTDPLHRVEISMLSTGDYAGNYAALFAMNQVDLKACDESLPPVPNLSCAGFAAPMANHPVKSKKNRAFPLKMELFDENGVEQTDLELLALPVVTITFTAAASEALDVSDAVLATGLGTEGNQFDYTDDGVWQFNLKSNDYTAEGTYTVTAVSGDESVYTINPSCVTSFIK